MGEQNIVNCLTEILFGAHTNYFLNKLRKKGHRRKLEGRGTNKIILGCVYKLFAE